MSTLVLILIAIIAVIHFSGCCGVALFLFGVNTEYRIMDWKMYLVILIWEPVVLFLTIFVAPVIYKATKESIKNREHSSLSEIYSKSEEEEKV